MPRPTLPRPVLPRVTFLGLTLLIALTAAARGAEIPRVALSEQHRAMCKVGVGDAFPFAALPAAEDAAFEPGKKAAVVVFYDVQAAQTGWMTRLLLQDFGPDVIDAYGGRGVTAVAVGVGNSPPPAAKYPQLLDADGAAFAQIGTGRLPRVYVTDAAGKIVWMDIEYSNSTRRELRATLEALTAEAK